MASMVSSGYDVRRYVFAEAASALYHAESAYVAELVHQYVGADDGIVVYDNLACHFCGIADDATVADKGIVCNMYTFHQQVVAANDCLSFGSRTPVDCHVLADGIIIAYLGGSLFSPEFQVLRDSTDYSSGKDCIPVADA